MGWLHVLVPEAAGGLGFSAVEAGIVSEEAGRALFPGPLVEAMAVGSVPGVDPLGTTLADPDRTALLFAGGRVAGTAGFVPYADRCDRLVACAESSLVLVDLAAAGVVREPAPSFDTVSRPVRVVVDGVPGRPLAGDVAVARLQTLVRSLLAARLLGMIDAVLERAVAYAMQREQFGRPIGSFQAVQQLLAELAKLAVATRSACYASQASIADERPDAERRARAAKAYATRAARSVAESAIQVHGGIGFTTEVPVHLYLKHVLTLEPSWGDEHDHEQALGRLALELPR
jgi:acyl-CoA dehydrogenase